MGSWGLEAARGANVVSINKANDRGKAKNYRDGRDGECRALVEVKKVMSGIPQGLVLGPVLFLVFIDDLEEGLMSKVLKFADDTKIFRRVDSEEDRNVLQRDLDRLVQWSEMWQMKFNIAKF